MAGDGEHLDAVRLAAGQSSGSVRPGWASRIEAPGRAFFLGDRALPQNTSLKCKRRGDPHRFPLSLSLALRACVRFSTFDSEARLRFRASPRLRVSVLFVGSLYRGSVPEGFPLAWLAEDEGPQVANIIAAAFSPSHSCSFEALANYQFARRFDRA